MKVMSIFNNKGGVGKTTLTFHLAHALVEMGKKVLLMEIEYLFNTEITVCYPISNFNQVI